MRSTTHKSQKEKQAPIQHPRTDEWMSSLPRTHAKEEHSTIKKNNTLTHATVCMDLEDTMLSKRGQTQKATD